jgi:hypothetical protein
MSTYLERSEVKCNLINICSVLLCACNVLIREIASFVSHFPALEARAFSRLSLSLARSPAYICMHIHPNIICIPSRAAEHLMMMGWALSRTGCMRCQGVATLVHKAASGHFKH